ncbi:hypothetical protein [Haladaptatus sp. NG-WS-4]
MGHRDVRQGALVGLVALWFSSSSGLVTFVSNGAIAVYVYRQHEVYVPRSPAHA